MLMRSGMLAVVASPASAAVPEAFARSVQALLKARDAAMHSRVDKWRYALEACDLFELGLDRTDVRDLVNRGLVEVAFEFDGSACRVTDSHLTFDQRLFFVLSEEGAETAERFAASHVQAGPTRLDQVQAKPNWDPWLRQLWFRGQLVKEFRQPAGNQVLLIESFQEQEWANCIDDPLPRNSSQCSKARLHDAIKHLNRNQVNRLLRFRGDGSGQRVIWCPR